MNAHFSEQLIEQYLRRELSPIGLLEADDHLAECEDCRRRLGADPVARRAARSLLAELETPESNHLEYEQLEAYLEGAVDAVDREIADSHLSLCASCAFELKELREFAAEIAAPPPATAVVHAKPEPSAGVHWRERLGALWRWPVVWAPLQVAGVGLIIGLLVWGYLLRVRNKELRAALEEQRRSIEKLNQDYQAKSGVVAELEKRLAALETPSSFLTTLEDGGGRIALDRTGNLTGVAQPYQEIVKQTLISGRVETPSMLASLAGKAAELMGTAGEGLPFALGSPVGVVVLSDRPAFRWRALEGAETYQLRIFDADFNEVAASPKIRGTAWTASTPLKRGRVYSWQATAFLGDMEVLSPVKPAPDAKFLVLDQAKAEELARAKNENPGAHLTLGALYARAGLVEEAEREFRSLSQANPRSETAQRLLRDIRSKKR